MVQAEDEVEPTIDQLGPAYTNSVVPAFRNFCFVPYQTLDSIADQALDENWGQNNYVLMKYLAVHVRWILEQQAFTKGEGQWYATAGRLQTRYGTPIYLVFEPNENQCKEPWYLAHAGSQISAPKLPTPPEIPLSPQIPRGAEIVMNDHHILKERADRVDFLADTPPVAQMCAVAGAIQWSLNRDLHVPYWYFGEMNYLVPLYLRSREDITSAPDLIAPIQVNDESVLVRTVLDPDMPYPNARVAVARHDQLPGWLLDAWKVVAADRSEAQLEDPEAPTAAETSNDAPTPAVSAPAAEA